MEAVSAKNILSPPTTVVKKTEAVQGQNPTFEQKAYGFHYQKLTKTGGRVVAQIQEREPANKTISAVRQLDFTLYKKTMLFTDEKIGKTTI